MAKIVLQLTTKAQFRPSTMKSVTFVLQLSRPHHFRPRAIIFSTLASCQICSTLLPPKFCGCYCLCPRPRGANAASTPTCKLPPEHLLASDSRPCVWIQHYKGHIERRRGWIELDADRSRPRQSSLVALPPPPIASTVELHDVSLLTLVTLCTVTRKSLSHLPGAHASRTYHARCHPHLPAQWNLPQALPPLFTRAWRALPPGVAIPIRLPTKGPALGATAPINPCPRAAAGASTCQWIEPVLMNTTLKGTNWVSSRMNRAWCRQIDSPHWILHRWADEHRRVPPHQTPSHHHNLPLPTWPPLAVVVFDLQPNGYCSSGRGVAISSL